MFLGLLLVPFKFVQNDVKTGTASTGKSSALQPGLWEAHVLPVTHVLDDLGKVPLLPGKFRMP